MKKLILLGIVVGLVAAFALPAVALKAPARINLDGPTKAPVVFDHAGHEARISDCKTCHHMGVGTGTCLDCHGKIEQAPSVKRAMHRSCRKCHTDMGVANWKDCGFCHK